MSYLSMMEARLPPGFRFHPRDEELVCDYLVKKISGDSLYATCPVLIDVDLNKCEPWDLPEMACVGGKEWYFFSLRDRKYATGQRTNRATVSGYWKATGKDKQVTRRGVLVGMRKTLVFYQGRAPKGRKSDWVMHEFRMEAIGDAPKFSLNNKDDWVLCRVFYKSRGLSSKPGININTNYEDNTSSSSLPPLMETYVNFNGHGQTPMSLEGYEQVPCFSNPFHNSTVTMVGPPVLMIGRSTPINNIEHADSRFDQLNQMDCDKKVMREVLNHMTMLEGNNQKRGPPKMSLGEGSIDGYLSDNGLSSMW